MRFESILFAQPGAESGVGGPQEPDYFADLNLDQVLKSMTAGREQYELKPFFYAISRFAEAMRRRREHLEQARKLHYQLQKQAWILNAAEIYCAAVRALPEELDARDVTSRGLRRVTVSRYEGEPDYGAEVEETFAKFKQGAVKSYLVRLPEYAEMDHVEAQIIGLVAKLYPDVCGTQDRYCTRHRDYLDQTIGRFDREVQFYLAYLELIGRRKSAGLPFCYPHVSARSKEIAAEDTFDLALANKLVPAGRHGRRQRL
jgi:DNA mismatch repair protein MutS